MHSVNMKIYVRSLTLVVVAGSALIVLVSRNRIVGESGLLRHRSLQESPGYQQYQPLFQSEVQPQSMSLSNRQTQDQATGFNSNQQNAYFSNSFSPKQQQPFDPSSPDQNQHQTYSASKNQQQIEPSTQEKPPLMPSDFGSGGKGANEQTQTMNGGFQQQPQINGNLRELPLYPQPGSPLMLNDASHSVGENSGGGSMHDETRAYSQPGQQMNPPSGYQERDQPLVPPLAEGFGRQDVSQTQKFGSSVATTANHSGDSSIGNPPRGQVNSQGTSGFGQATDQHFNYQQQGSQRADEGQRSSPQQPASLFSSGSTTFRQGDNTYANQQNPTSAQHGDQSMQQIQEQPREQPQQMQQAPPKREMPQQHISVPDQDPFCVVPNAAEVAVRNPTWTASYPGSGAKLTWKLIRAITGIFTSDDHDHNGRVEKGMVVAVKTHFPSHTDPQVFAQDKLRHISRTVLLTRNPLNSIPSYHNFVYEQQNGLLNHSTRAPIEAWIKWRNEFFGQELKNWIDHQKYWIDNYPREQGKFHLVAMEHLTSQERGPETLKQLGIFLARGEQDIADNMVPPERVPCIWDMFVHGKVPGERERRNSHRSGGPKEYPFTQPQLEQMIEALLQFKSEYQQHQDLAQIVDEYVFKIEEKKTQVQQL